MVWVLEHLIIMISSKEQLWNLLQFKTISIVYEPKTSINQIYTMLKKKIHSRSNSFPFSLFCISSLWCGFLQKVKLVCSITCNEYIQGPKCKQSFWKLKTQDTFDGLHSWLHSNMKLFLCNFEELKFILRLKFYISQLVEIRILFHLQKVRKNQL